MADANDLVRAMKKAARDERESSKPMEVFFGEVLSVAPLKVNVEQKMVLGEAQLVLCRNVTEYTTGGTILWETEKIEGKKQLTVHNALEKGEKVILLRQQGGQKFIVVDRIGGKA